MTEQWKKWKHITKIDPDKKITARVVDKIIESKTDAIMVSGTLGISKEKVRSYTTAEDKTPRNTYVPKGCLNCSYTGYRGRTGIFEMLVVNEELKDLIYRDASPDVIRNNYAKWGIENLRQKGIKKVLNGETTFEELDTVVSDTKSFKKEKT